MMSSRSLWSDSDPEAYPMTHVPRYKGLTLKKFSTSAKTAVWDESLGETCSICITDFAMEEKAPVVTTLRCSHTFHHNCIVTWLSRAHTCPLCKSSAHSGRDGSASSSTATLEENDRIREDFMQTEYVYQERERSRHSRREHAYPIDRYFRNGIWERTTDRRSQSQTDVETWGFDDTTRHASSDSFHTWMEPRMVDSDYRPAFVESSFVDFEDESGRFAYNTARAMSPTAHDGDLPGFSPDEIEAGVSEQRRQSFPNFTDHVPRHVTFHNFIEVYTDAAIPTVTGPFPTVRTSGTPIDDIDMESESPLYRHEYRPCDMILYSEGSARQSQDGSWPRGERTHWSGDAYYGQDYDVVNTEASADIPYATDRWEPNTAPHASTVPICPFFAGYGYAREDSDVNSNISRVRSCESFAMGAQAAYVPVTVGYGVEPTLTSYSPTLDNLEARNFANIPTPFQRVPRLSLSSLDTSQHAPRTETRHGQRFDEEGWHHELDQFPTYNEHGRHNGEASQVQVAHDAHEVPRRGRGRRRWNLQRASNGWLANNHRSVPVTPMHTPSRSPNRRQRHLNRSEGVHNLHRQSSNVHRYETVEPIQQNYPTSHRQAYRYSYPADRTQAPDFRRDEARTLHEVGNQDDLSWQIPHVFLRTHRRNLDHYLAPL